MQPQHQAVEMESFKAEVRQELGQMTASVNKLAESVQVLVEHEIRRQGREDRQAEINQDFGQRIDDLEEYNRIDEIRNAQSKQMNEFLVNKWPWLMVIVTGLAVIVPAVVSVMVKGVIGG